SACVTDRLLELQDLSIAYDGLRGRRGETRVVRGLDLTLHAGEALGLVGESGCGKSTVALSIVRYLGRAGRIVGGRILFEGRDVTVEAAVLNLGRELRRRIDSAILFISHNLATVAGVCDRIGVMYRGELVEDGPVRRIFSDPRHPYTRGLLDCLPTLGRDKR